MSPSWVYDVVILFFFNFVWATGTCVILLLCGDFDFALPSASTASKFIAFSSLLQSNWCWTLKCSSSRCQKAPSWSTWPYLFYRNNAQFLLSLAGLEKCTVWFADVDILRKWEILGYGRGKIVDVGHWLYLWNCAFQHWQGWWRQLMVQKLDFCLYLHWVPYI